MSNRENLMQEMLLELANMIITAAIATTLALWINEVMDKRNDHDEQDRDR